MAINRLPSAPARAHASLKIPPGYLNDFNVDDVDFQSIDFQSESPESILNRVRDKVFSSNKFKTSGTLVGILMRIDKDFSENCTALEQTAGATQGQKSRKYALNTYKIRVPELHFMLPVPNNIAKPDSQDKIIMDSYPTIQASDTWVNNQPMQPGDLVKVEISNKGAISRLYCTGPLDPKNVGNNKFDMKQCIADCINEYMQGGSVGDCNGQGTHLAKLNSGIPPVSQGGLVTDKPKIVGPYNSPSENWLAKIIAGLQKDGHYDGIVWLGPTGDSGVKDTLKLATPNKGGRQMFIYIPQGINLKSKLEIIYWFHNSADFADSTDTKSLWQGLVDPLKSMLQKSSAIKGKVRNFVLVVPEMPWSRGSMGNTLKPRVQSQSKLPNRYARRRYRDRHWGVWGFDGNVSTTGQKETTPAAITLAGNYSPAGSSTGGSLSDIHKKVLEILSSHGADNGNPPWVTFVGDRYGTAAIGVAARMNNGTLDPNPNKIQLFHGGYAADPLRGFLDSDLYYIANSVDSSQTLEIHLGPPNTGNETGPGALGASNVPIKAANAFFGALASSGYDIKDSYAAAIENLNGKFSFSTQGHDTNIADEEKVLYGHGGVAGAYSPLQDWYNAGKAFVSSTKSVRLAGPWKNIVFKKQNKSNTFGWLPWLSIKNGKPDVPSAFSVETADDKLKEKQASAGASTGSTGGAGTGSTSPTAPGTAPSKVPAAYDKDGNAYDSEGNKLGPEYKLTKPKETCEKGDLKKHTPETVPPKVRKDCEERCKILSGDQKKAAFDPANAHKIDKVIAPAVGKPNFKSSDNKRNINSITTILIHDACTSYGGMVAALNSKHLGTHFSVSSRGTHQHVDILRRTAHAKGANGRSIGIDVAGQHCRFRVMPWKHAGKSGKGKDEDPAAETKRVGALKPEQLVKGAFGGWGWGPKTHVIPNPGSLNKLYALVVALVKECPKVEAKFPAVGPGGYLFDQHASGATGIVAHGGVENNRSDGRYAVLYLYLRMKKGKSHTAAYAQMTKMAWKSAGFSSIAAGQAHKGKTYKNRLKRVPLN